MPTKDESGQKKGSSNQQGRQAVVGVIRGREISRRTAGRLQEMIDELPGLSREELGREACRRFRWRRPNGELAVRSCTTLFGRLERAGLLKLPKRRNGSGARRSEVALTEEDAALFIPTGALSGELVVRPLQANEKRWWHGLMARHHYLGDCKLVGESMCYAAFIGEQVVALIGFAAAALKCAVRDKSIGWNEPQRLKQLHLIVNNLRFLILPWVKVPNLASQILARSVRRLSADWRTVYGHEVVMVETFVDVSRFRGTCYQAANWRYLGQTQGFSRAGASYRPNHRPKAVYVYSLMRHAQARLLQVELPASRNIPEVSMQLDIERLPLEGEEGLFGLFGQVPDTRKQRGKRHPQPSILAMAACAMLCGAKGFTAIAQWAAELPRELRQKLGSIRPYAPSERTFIRTFNRLDADEFQSRIDTWWSRIQPIAGKAVALDGKTLKGSFDGEKKPVHLVSVVLHEEGTVLAQCRVPDKTNEITCVEALLGPLSLEGSVVTADAMHTQTKTATYIVEDKKADYNLTVKKNQPTLLEDIQDLHLEAFPP